MADTKKVNYDFSEETIKKKRKFPRSKAIILAILILLQIFCVLGICFYQPKAQDIIEDYRVYVTAKDDGTLDIEYKLRWTPLDADEPLEFIYLGIANPNYRVLEYSDNISFVEPYFFDDGECHVDLHLDRDYYKGDTLEISLKINQGSMLCRKGGEYFYEFVPSWFNSTPVKSYSFYWSDDSSIISTNSHSKVDGWYIWQGTMAPGEYCKMRVNCKTTDAPTTFYMPFNDEGAYNDLDSERMGVVMILVVAIVVLFIFEVFCVDIMLSYHRGRGFIHGYGHPMYTYGRINRHYIVAQNQHNADSAHAHSGGRGHSGGCACACACACAGGGRAGCSQKDTYKSGKNGEKTENTLNFGSFQT